MSSNQDCRGLRDRPTPAYFPLGSNNSSTKPPPVDNDPHSSVAARASQLDQHESLVGRFAEAPLLGRTVNSGRLIAGGESRDRQSTVVASVSPPRCLHSYTESRCGYRMAQCHLGARGKKQKEDPAASMLDAQRSRLRLPLSHLSPLPQSSHKASPTAASTASVPDPKSIGELALFQTSAIDGNPRVLLCRCSRNSLRAPRSPLPLPNWHRDEIATGYGVPAAQGLPSTSRGKCECEHHKRYHWQNYPSHWSTAILAYLNPSRLFRYQPCMLSLQFPTQFFSSKEDDD